VTDYIVSSGQFTTNLGPRDTGTIEQTGSSVDIVDGGVEIVFGGGYALSNTIVDGALILSSGGSAYGAQVSSGGAETVSAGAATSGETIVLSGSSLVLAGGVASAIVISSGGVEHLAGGVAYNVDVVRGGLLSGSGTLFSADDYGTVSGVTVGSSLDVFADGVANGVIDSGLAAPGDYYHYGVFVSSRGAVNGTTVGAAGYLELDSSGSATNTLILSGGDVAGNAGVVKGVTSNAGIISGVTNSGTLIDLAGGYDSGNVIATGATLVVSVGGSTYNDTLDRGAVLSGGGVVYSLSDLGTVSGVTVGSSLDVSAGGIAYGVIDSGLAAPGAYYHYGVFVSSRGAVVATTVGAGGYLELESSGSATNTVVLSGGDVAGDLGVLKGVTSNAGVISGVTFSGRLIELAGGYDSGNVIAAGATVVLNAGASTYNDRLDRGAVLSGGGAVYSLDDLGTVSGVSVGSSLDVSAGGLAENVTISGLGAAGGYYHEGLFISSQAAGENIVVGAGGYLELDGSGRVVNTKVSAGGYVSATTASGVLAGVTSNAGVVSNAIISGTLIDLAGGSDNTDTLVNGSVEDVAVGASAYHVSVDRGAVLSGGGIVFSAEVLGSVVSVTLGSSLDIEAGGVALDIVDGGLNAAGNYYHQGLFVSSGASATGTTVGASGYLELDATGSAIGTTVSSGGLLSGVGGGYLRGVTTNSGTVTNITDLGVLTDIAGAYDSNDTIARGASDIVESGGVTNDITVSAGGQLYGGGVVSAGTIYGLASNVAVGSSLDIQSGGLADGVTISGLNAAGNYYHQGLFVHAGGQASGAAVGANGYLELDGTGSSLATQIASGGLVSGVGGGVLKGDTANAGTVANVTLSGAFTDLSGGVDQYDTVAYRAVAVVDSGAATYHVTIDRGGLLSGGGVVYSGDDFGTVTELAVGSSLDVSSGGVADDVTISGLNAAGSYYHQGLFISAGATASGALVDANGYLELDSTGSAAATTVAAGGVVAGSEGGVLVGQTINAGVVSNLTVEGTFNDLAGGYEYSDTVASRAVDNLLAGGSAASVTIAQGGEIVGGGVVYSADDYGTVSGVQVGSSLDVLSGGDAQGVTISGLNAAGNYYHQGLFISTGASATGTLVGAAGYLELDGGVASATTVFAGGAMYDGGLASGAVVMSGGVLSGTGSAVGVIVASSGATVDLGAILSGGVDDYYAGASESLTVSSGGVLALAGQVLSAGETLQIGLVTRTEVVSGVTVLSGATVQLAATLIASGETLDVTSGAVLSGLTLQSGGAIGGAGLLEGQIVASSGAELSGARIASGGELVLSGGAVASGLVISKGAVVSGPGLLAGKTTVDGETENTLVGGQLTIATGGVLSGATLLPGATVSVASGAKLEGVIELAGAVTLVIARGATVSAESVNEFYSSPPEKETLPGGDTLELVGAVVTSGVVFAAGKQLSAFAIDGVTLDPGAILALAAPVVLAGGTIDVRSGPSVVSALEARGGVIVVSSGGVLVSPTIDGTATFQAGAALAGVLTGDGRVTEAGGALVLKSAAAFAGEVMITSGLVELAGSGGVGSASIDFAAGSTGSARLAIEAVDTPAARTRFASELLNFSQTGDSLFLAGLPDSGGAAKAVLRGSELVVTDGGKTYDFSLGGQLASGFVVSSLNGGTLITASPPLTAKAQVMVQAMATFGGSSEAPGAATGSGLTSATSTAIAEPHAATAVPILSRR
jgi:autotransporter passenger strand-loop-strand repeat protein